MVKKRHHLYTMANSEQATLKSSEATTVHSKVHLQSEQLALKLNTEIIKLATGTAAKEEASKHRDMPHRD